MEKKINLTILIPALNEENTIKTVINKAYTFLNTNKINGEVLVINNGSTDQTVKVALENGARVETENNRGYGNAIKYGIKKAKGKYIIMADADNSYNLLEIDNIYYTLIKGAEFVIGNRFYNLEKGSMKFLHRYIGTPFLNFCINKKYNVKIKDVNCGLRGFEKNIMKELKLESQGMEIASEMIIKAIIKKVNIQQVDINFYKDDRGRRSHLRTIKDGIRHLKVIL